MKQILLLTPTNHSRYVSKTVLLKGYMNSVFLYPIPILHFLPVISPSSGTWHYVYHIGNSHEPTEWSKQPIRTRNLGHVTGYQPIRDQCFLIRLVPGNSYCGMRSKVLTVTERGDSTVESHSPSLRMPRHRGASITPCVYIIVTKFLPRFFIQHVAGECDS